MKNKKLLLSVLSTAVVASMASSAFAAEAGIYIGGDVKHYYNISSFFEPTNSAKIVSEANSAKLKNVVFVDTTGKAATLDNILASGSAALTDDLEAVFGDSLHDAYVPVDKNGQEGTDPVVPEPSDSPSVDGLTQVVDGGKVTISGNAVNADSVEVTVFKASEKVATKSVDVADNKFSVDFADLVAGDYTYEVVASNADEDSEVKSGSFKVEAPAELKVDSVSAIDGIASNANIEATFNIDVDASTVTPTTVYLVNETGVRQAAAVSYDAATKKATLDPSVDLDPGKKYTFKIDGVKTTDATPSTITGFSKEFTVGQQPVISSVDVNDNAAGPAEATDVDSGFTVDPTADRDALGIPDTDFYDGQLVFNSTKELDPATVSTTTVKVYNVTDSKYEAVSATLNSADYKQLLVSSVNGFAKDKQYRVTLSANIKDLAGNALGNDFNTTFSVVDPANTVTFDNTSGDDIRVGDVLMGSGGVNDVTVTSTTTKINPSKTTAPGTFPILMQAQFTGNLDTATVNTTNVYLTKKGETTKVPVTVEYNASNYTVTVTPVSDLAESAEYVLTFGTGVKSDLGYSITKKTVSFKTGDFTKPTITSTVPTAGSSTASNTANFEIAFSEDMDAASLTLGDNAGKFSNGNISLYDNTAKAYIDISGWTKSYDKASKKLVVTPANLKVNNTYTLYVKGGTAGVLDTAKAADGTTAKGNGLASDYSLTFTTAGDTTVPTVASIKGSAAGSATGAFVVTNGTTNVDGDEDITVTFNDKDLTPIADAALASNTAVTLYDVTAATYVTAPHFELVDGGANADKLVIKTGASALTDGHKYRLVLTNAIKDQAGNRIVPATYEFTVGQGPRATILNPTEGSKTHAVSDPVEVTLSTLAPALEVDGDTVNANTVKLINNATGEVVPATITLNAGTALDSASKIVITPTNDLAGSTTYKVWISKDVKDTYGNQLSVVGQGAADFEYLFSTVDSVAPTFVSSSVANNATNVDLSPTIELNFSEAVALDNGTTTPAAIPANGAGVVTLASYSDYADGVIDSPILVNVTQSNAGKTLKVSATGLASNSKYVLVVTGDNISNSAGIVDSVGNNLEADQTIFFTTGGSDSKAAAFLNKIGFSVTAQTTGAGWISKVAGTYAQVADATDNILVPFDESVDATTATVTIKNITDDKAVGVISVTSVDDLDSAGATGADANDHGLVIVPAAGLEANKFYQVTISGVKDSDGNVTPDVTFIVKGTDTP